MEAQAPAYFHISTASVHDSKAMKHIPCKSEFTVYLTVVIMPSKNTIRNIYTNHFCGESQESTG